MHRYFYLIFLLLIITSCRKPAGTLSGFAETKRMAVVDEPVSSAKKDNVLPKKTDVYLNELSSGMCAINVMCMYARTHAADWRIRKYAADLLRNNQGFKRRVVSLSEKEGWSFSESINAQHENILYKMRGLRKAGVDAQFTPLTDSLLQSQINTALLLSNTLDTSGAIMEEYISALNAFKKRAKGMK